MDEYRTVAAAVTRDGKVNCWHAASGKPLNSIPMDFKGKQITAFSKCIDGTNIAFGLSDGAVRFARIIFETNVIPRDGAPKDLTGINDQDSTDGAAVYSKVPGDQLRRVSVSVQLEDEVKISETDSPIIAMDYRFGDFGERPRRTLVTLDSHGIPVLAVGESKLNLFTNKLTTKVSKTTLPPLAAGASIAYAQVNDIGDTVYFAEKSGRIYRYNVSDASDPFLAGTADLLPEGSQLTSLGFLLGDRSLVAGGADGSVSIYFLLSREKSSARDGQELILTRTFERQPAAITGFSPGQRGKTFATSDARGGIWIRQGTSQKTLLRLEESSKRGSVEALTLAPRANGVLSLGQGGVADLWTVSIQHPEISWKTLLGKVWYEGYPEPSYTWQSAGATDAFEPKISLIPLIFGSFKATFYSLLFAVPIALLAAIYTSEFLSPSVSRKVKPVMEVMASLPSVVLGFVAALVLAPVVETWIAAILLTLAVLPLSLIFCAYLWQMLPSRVALLLEGLPKFLVMFVVVGGSLFLSYDLGPLFEKLFFQGDFKTWVSGSQGSVTPFMFMLAVPATAAVVSLLAARIFGRWFNLYLRRLPMPYSAMLDLLRWLGVAAATGMLAYTFAWLSSALGLDPRGSVVGTYVQRNTLVVGFAMGFAVIPIIYTLAEDSLNAVPDHLRSASLGCGATPWQTAMWIVLPTALSGVFSAVMIGMGRAVGETMIVVMSAGNTPLLDLNIFNGLRALSANIAVELPEAPKDGTLYRVLFFTGLLLFAMTFVINTAAELVRLHFRKRATQL